MLVSLLALSFSVAAPPAPVLAEMAATVDPVLGPAMELLRTSPTTAHLPGVLDESGVAVTFVPMDEGMFARYSLSRRRVEVGTQWMSAAPETLATVIAHETVHVQDAVSGALARGGATGCIDSEIKAFRTAALFWIELYGPQGKLGANTELERQLNLAASYQAQDSPLLEDLVRLAYSGQCGS